jgi:glutaredoxin-like protein NrdH
MSVIVYTKSNCTQCEQTKRLLNKLEIPFEERNLETDPAALEEFKKKGLLAAPIVVTNRGTWSGFKFERIEGLKR